MKISHFWQIFVKILKILQVLKVLVSRQRNLLYFLQNYQYRTANDISTIACVSNIKKRGAIRRMRRDRRPQFYCYMYCLMEFTKN